MRVRVCGRERTDGGSGQSAEVHLRKMCIVSSNGVTYENRYRTSRHFLHDLSKVQSRSASSVTNMHDPRPNANPPLCTSQVTVRPCGVHSISHRDLDRDPLRESLWERWPSLTF